MTTATPKGRPETTAEIVGDRPEAFWTWDVEIHRQPQTWRGLRRLLHLLPAWTAPEAQWEDGTAAPVPLEES